MWEKSKTTTYKEELEEQIIDELEPREITPEEKQDIKKTMVILIWIVLIIVFSYILINLLFKFMDKKEKQVIKVENEEEVRESLPDGEIATNNKIIQEIDKMFEFDKRNPLYEENILKIFGNDKKKVEDLDFQSKMLLITSNNIFNNYMINKTNLINYKNKEVSITKKKLEELSNEIFGRDINLQHQNFKYYYIENNNVVYFNVTLKEDKYIFSLAEGKESSIEIIKNVNNAYKIGNQIYIQYDLYMIKNKISSKSTIYELIYLDSNESYYLENINKRILSEGVE